jgi:hypothetical protein
MPDPWSWGWDALVAIGTMAAALSTLVLATVTAWMANETRKVAVRTEDEVVLASSLPSNSRSAHVGQ